MSNMNHHDHHEDQDDPIVDALYLIAAELNSLRESGWNKSQHELITKKDLQEIQHNIMTKIADFAARQEAFNLRVDAAVAGVSGDVQALTDLVTQLQGTQGDITPEDQALLDQIEARSDAIAAKVEALDALTPPVAPPVVENPPLPPVVSPPLNPLNPQTQEQLRRDAAARATRK